MIRFIWQNWWRNKQRFLLLIIGALIVSAGLSYLVGLSETNRLTIVDELQERWNAPYDILVRAPETRSVTEELNLLEPNYLSGLAGGISIEQYEQIQQMEHVHVAAPIAMIGYENYSVVFDEADFDEPGVYRIHTAQTTDIGPREDIQETIFYTVSDEWSIEEHGREATFDYGVVGFNGELTAGSDVLLAGIDPEAEAAFIGINEAVLDIPNSRYFEEGDRIMEGSGFAGDQTSLPVLLSDSQFVDKNYIYTIERLDLPFDDRTTAEMSMETVKENGGESYLNSLDSVDERTYTFSSVEAHQAFLESYSGIDPATGEPVETRYETRDSAWMTSLPSQLHYNPVNSPFPERWPFAYEIDVYEVQDDDSYAAQDETFRPVRNFGESSDDWPRLQLDFVGFYDPGKLDLPLDPLTELPMETYRPATANLALA